MFRRKVAGLLVLFAVGVPASGGVLYQTATMGVPSSAGLSITQLQFLGARFTLNSSSVISDIIGEIGSFGGGNPEMFMALFQLSGPDTFPSNVVGTPFANAPLYSTTFNASSPGGDISFPVSLSVQPGTYAVVFGTGLFGASTAGTAGGYMPFGVSSGNVVQPGADLITWYDDTGAQNSSLAKWHNGTNQGERFVVQGDTTPEPGSALLIGSGITAMALLRSRRRRHPRIRST
jgi:hypothetical protein